MHFQSPSFAIGPIVRYNFHMRSAIRVNAIYHTLRGSDPEYFNGRGAEFTGQFIDFAASYEFNFTPYKSSNTRKYTYSLYTAAGLGYNYFLGGTPAGNDPMSGHFTIPFSVGFKFNVGRRLSAGLEWSPRKVFTDSGIDGVKNIGEEESNLHLFGNNDWYTFAGVFITYKIFDYREDCPTYD
jgi:hypothetical protein